MSSNADVRGQLDISWDPQSLLSEESQETLSVRLSKMLVGLSGHPEHGADALRPVSVLFCDDAQIQSLNRQWRGLDKSTDVLSFAFDEADAPPIVMEDDDFEMPLGDIVISVPTAQGQSHGNGWSTVDELTFLFAHGLSHLLGHDHAEPEESAVMATLERELLGFLGMLRPTNLDF